MAHGNDSTDEAMKVKQLKDRMEKIAHKIVVLSGKGGVGKSTVSVNLAAALALSGKRVGILDVDVHGPSVPTMLGLTGQSISANDEGMIPVTIPSLNNLAVMSVGFLIGESDSPVIWRGPMKAGVIRQLLGEVNWGDLDYLIVDCPPGTGDEPLSVIQMMVNVDGAVIVTTPQEVSAIDVSKSINFCARLALPVIGIIENMSGFVCPHCGEVTDIFNRGGGKRLSEKYGVPFLGDIPIDPAIGVAGDLGITVVEKHRGSPVAKMYEDIASRISSKSSVGDGEDIMANNKIGGNMKVAIPTANGRLNSHFGHCDNLIIFEVDEKSKTILSKSDLTPPPHEPGLLPRWLGERGINLVIAGGMGGRAQSLFA
ncbi:MAG TPA: iron-sulfur cluster carrier protein MrpORP, partial [Spirochaetota bacterium]|nr:iron-sulfur cluster carrier protein MrpORP [Spirochaetota bacterium]